MNSQTPLLEATKQDSALQEQSSEPEQGKSSFQPPRQSKGLAVLRSCPWIAAIIAALVIGCGIGNFAGRAPADSALVVQSAAQTSPPSASISKLKQLATLSGMPAQSKSNSTATASSRWVTTHTFSVSGLMKTPTFTVSNKWRLQWTCNPAASSAGSFRVGIAVYHADGTPLDPMAFNTTCSAGNTSGATLETQSGSVYCDVATQGNITITVQEERK